MCRNGALQENETNNFMMAKILCWCQKTIFWYQEIEFLISENDFLISNKRTQLFLNQKIYILISKIQILDINKKNLVFLILNGSWIFDVRNSFSDIKNSTIKNSNFLIKYSDIKKWFLWNFFDIRKCLKNIKTALHTFDNTIF